MGEEGCEEKVKFLRGYRLTRREELCSGDGKGSRGGNVH